MKIKLTRKQHNEIFKNRKLGVAIYYEYIDDPDNEYIVIRKRIRFIARVTTIVLSPLFVLIGGVPSMINMVKECVLNEPFDADFVGRDWFYSQIKRIVNESE